MHLQALHYGCDGSGRDTYVHLNNGGFSAYSLPTSPKQTPLPLRTSMAPEKHTIFSGMGRGNTHATLLSKTDQKLVRVFGEAAALRGPVYSHILGEQRRSQSVQSKRLATPKYKSLTQARDRPITDTIRSLGKSQSVPALHGGLSAMAGRPPLQQSFRMDGAAPLGSASVNHSPSAHTRQRQDMARNFGTSFNGTITLPSYALGSYDIHQRNLQHGLRGTTRTPQLEALPQQKRTLAVPHPMLGSSWDSTTAPLSRGESASRMTKSRSETTLRTTQRDNTTTLRATTVLSSHVPSANPAV